MLTLTKRLAMGGIALASVLGVAAPVISQVAAAPAAEASSCYWYVSGKYRSGKTSYYLGLTSTAGGYRTVGVSLWKFQTTWTGQYWSDCSTGGGSW